jgi:hypothetical protein
MLKGEELANIRALSAVDISPACQNHLMATIGKKRPAASGKRKVAELASASDGQRIESSMADKKVWNQESTMGLIRY